jgi:hypothetical protein
MTCTGQWHDLCSFMRIPGNGNHSPQRHEAHEENLWEWGNPLRLPWISNREQKDAKHAKPPHPFCELRVLGVLVVNSRAAFGVHHGVQGLALHFFGPSHNSVR